MCKTYTYVNNFLNDFFKIKTISHIFTNKHKLYNRQQIEEILKNLASKTENYDIFEEIILNDFNIIADNIFRMINTNAVELRYYIVYILSHEIEKPLDIIFCKVIQYLIDKSLDSYLYNILKNVQDVKFKEGYDQIVKYLSRKILESNDNDDIIINKLNRLFKLSNIYNDIIESLDFYAQCIYTGDVSNGFYIMLKEYPIFMRYLEYDSLGMIEMMFRLDEKYKDERISILAKAML